MALALCEDGIPFGDGGERASGDRLGAQAGRIEAGAEAEGRDADFCVVGKILLRDAADCADDRVLRQHGLDRRDAFRAERACREEFQRRCAERQRQEGFGRGEHAGHGDHAVMDGALHDGTVDVGADQQPSAGAVEGVDLPDRQHRAGADQRRFRQRFCQQLDRAERVGRVQRHLDRLDAGLEDRGADGERLVGLHAAQDRDEPAAEFREGHGHG